MRAPTTTPATHVFSGAPEEFPQGFDDFEAHRRRFLEERRRDAERWCANALVRDLCAELRREPPPRAPP